MTAAYVMLGVGLVLMLVGWLDKRAQLRADRIMVAVRKENQLWHQLVHKELQRERQR